jgi:hypothetical protein
MIISDPRVLVANGNGKEFKVPFGRFQGRYRVMTAGTRNFRKD